MKEHSDSMREIMRLAGLPVKDVNAKVKIKMNTKLGKLVKRFKKKQKPEPEKKIERVEHIEVTLPFPPSVNKYWGTAWNGRKYLMERGKKYKSDVALILLSNGFTSAKLTEKIKLHITTHAPDKRRRDLDNLLKAILDSMNKYVYEDDFQVCDLHIHRGHVDKFKPRIEVIIDTIIST